jgi:hypothetical protein
MGHNIHLTAGRLSVAIQSDEEELQPVVSAAHNEMRWLVNQWVQVDGAIAHGSEFRFEG